MTMSANLLATFHLVTFICQDATLTDCEVYTSKPMSEQACEVAAVNVGNRAKVFNLPETIVFYCTEDINDLPINVE